MRKTLQRSLLGSLGAVSGTTTYTSLWQTIDSFEHYMIQATWSGTPSAQVSLVCSADPIQTGYTPLSSFAPTNFDYVANSQLSTTSVVVGPSGSYIVTYDVVVSGANWVAFQWVNASSTGTILSVNFVGKGSQV